MAELVRNALSTYTQKRKELDIYREEALHWFRAYLQATYEVVKTNNEPIKFDFPGALGKEILLSPEGVQFRDIVTGATQVLELDSFMVGLEFMPSLIGIKKAVKSIENSRIGAKITPELVKKYFNYI